AQGVSSRPCFARMIREPWMAIFGRTGRKVACAALIARHGHSLLSGVGRGEAMRTLWIAMAMACTARCAAADVPFAPIANVPDYVLTIDAGYTLFHHAGRFRADRIEGPKSTEFFPADGATHISVRSDAFDFASRIELVRNAKPPDDSVAGLTRGSSNTG